MVAGIILIIVGVIGIFFAIFIVKGNMNLIAGFNTLSKEEQSKVDQKKLKWYILRILLSIITFLIEIGIVFIIKLVKPVAISVPIFLVGVSTIGIIMYYLSDKFKNKIIDIFHIIFTTILMVLSPIIIVLFTFYL